MVRECVPAGSLLSRVTPLRTAYVSAPRDALVLPWIEKLPGEKRVRFVNGQIFVIQSYVGCHLIRAHIYHEQEQETPRVGDTDHAFKTESRMSLEYVL